MIYKLFDWFHEEEIVNALLIGADRLGNIPTLLEDRGVQKFEHWDGRKKGMRKMKIPTDVDVVIVFTDFIEHRLTERIKTETKAMNIPCIFSRRAVSDLSMQMDRCQKCGLCDFAKTAGIATKLSS